MPQACQDGRQLTERVALIGKVPRPAADAVREVAVGGDERLLPEGTRLRSVGAVDEEGARGRSPRSWRYELY